MGTLTTQQAVLRAACLHVLKRIPAKGDDAKAAFTPEVRAAIANYMIPLLDVEWTIKSDLAKANPRGYIMGNKPTDLLQHWTLNPERKPKSQGETAANPLDIIKQALDLGLITKEAAEAKVLELLK